MDWIVSFRGGKTHLFHLLVWVILASDVKSLSALKEKWFLRCCYRSWKLLSLEDIHQSLLNWFHFFILVYGVLIFPKGSITLLSHQFVDIVMMPVSAVSSFMHLSSYSFYQFPLIYDPNCFKQAPCFCVTFWINFLWALPNFGCDSRPCSDSTVL